MIFPAFFCDVWRGEVDCHAMIIHGKGPGGKGKTGKSDVFSVDSGEKALYTGFTKERQVCIVYEAFLSLAKTGSNAACRVEQCK